MTEYSIPAEVQEQTALVLGRAAAIVVRTQDDLDYAGDALRVVKSQVKQLTELRLSLTRPIDDSKANIMNIFKAKIEPLEAEVTRITKGMSDYITAQRQEQERLQREARLKAEAEERRLFQLEQAAIARAAAATTDKARAEAEAKAEEFQQRAAAVIAPVVAPLVDNPVGTHTQTRWSAEGLSLIDTVKAAASGNKTALAVLQYNEVKLNQLATALKDDFDIPGCLVSSKLNIVSRGRNL